MTPTPPITSGDLVKLISVRRYQADLGLAAGDTGTVTGILGWPSHHPDRKMLRVFLWRTAEEFALWEHQLTLIDTPDL
jgi:hypothetical protein